MYLFLLFHTLLNLQNNTDEAVFARRGVLNRAIGMFNKGKYHRIFAPVSV